MSCDRFVDEVGPRERIAWDRMKSELTAANERCVRLREEREDWKQRAEALDAAARRLQQADEADADPDTTEEAARDLYRLLELIDAGAA